MKPPDHPVPSGDRRMARLLIEAFGHAGHEVELACRLRSRDAAGDPRRQARLRNLGAALARRLTARYLDRPEADRPAAWVTYHLYYKAPDWIGPAVAEDLGIPYIVAEASVAPKRAGGPWEPGHAATLAALERAAAVITLNPVDIDCLPDPARVYPLRPFLDPAPYRAAAADRPGHRELWATRLNLDRDLPWLVVAAMMRPGDKLRSYRMLAEALAVLADLPWQIAIAGDGPERDRVESAMVAAAPNRYRFAGELDTHSLSTLYAACDLFVWPAVNEAYGMALLEAQAAGLPVVAGRSGGVPQIVRDNETGLLLAPTSPGALATALRELILDPERRNVMSCQAVKTVEADHGLAAAARQLDEILTKVGAGRVR